VYPPDLTGSKTRFPSRPCCPDCRKTLDQCDSRFPAEPFLHLTSDSFRGVSSLRVPGIPTLLRTLRISRSENGSVEEQISARGESSPVSSRIKRRPFWGDIGGLLAGIWRLNKTVDCMVDQVESEPFSTAESRQQTNLGPIWSNLRLPVMRTECVNECNGDWALVQTHPRREAR
jgi:hypothetical protein